MQNEVELIIIDGGSGNEIYDVVADLPGNVSMISEADDGIYDAMNKGLRLSQGEFVWFLNGGDVCVVPEFSELVESLSRSAGKLVFAGYKLDTGYGNIPRRPRDARYIWHGLPTSHQAIFYPGAKARANEYDVSYRIVGDYEFTARILADGTPSCRLEMEVAAFQLGGTSQVHAKLVAIEASRVQKVILGMKWHSLVRSRLRHTISRNVRSFQSRSWGRFNKSFSE
jgi:putative colanic acid biosynthesis glycosyltransferase